MEETVSIAPFPHSLQGYAPERSTRRFWSCAIVLWRGLTTLLADSDRVMPKHRSIHSIMCPAILSSQAA